jgi:hypothetical protein
MIRARPYSTATALALGLALAAGCADTPTEAEALLVALEAEAALQVSTDLPLLPGLAGSVASAPGSAPDPALGTLAQARTLWLDAQDAPDPRIAGALRDAAYVLAVPVLAERLAEADLARADAAAAGWIEVAARAIRPLDPAGIAGALVEARLLLEAGRAARAEGRTEDAVEALLRASDRLATTTPRAVALRLIAAGDERLAHVVAERGLDPRQPADLAAARARRLLISAREAVADGRHELAIRRAFYAGQLLKP